MRKIIVITLLIVTMNSLMIGCNLQESEQGLDPGKGLAQKISAAEKQRLDLYVAVMKEAFNVENGGDTFLAVKLNTLKELSHDAKLEVLDELKALSSNVHSFEEVQADPEKFEIDDRGNLVQSFDGTLLWVEIEKYSAKKAIITGVSWFGNLGAVFPKYEATYVDGVWQLELINIAIS